MHMEKCCLPYYCSGLLFESSHSVDIEFVLSIITVCCACNAGSFSFLVAQGVTMVKFLTDGVLLREMMDDPLLTKYRY